MDSTIISVECIDELADFAPAANYVETEPTGFVPPDLSFGQVGKQRPDVGKHPRISSGVAPWSPTDGALVNVDHLIEVLEAGDFLVVHRPLYAVVEMLPQNRIQRFVDQCGFARTAHSGNAGEGSQRNFNIDVLQVVARSALELQEVAVAFTALLRHFNLAATGEVIRRNASGARSSR